MPAESTTEREHRKQAERDRRIQELKADGAARGQHFGDAYWALVYDNECAPLTTDAQLLREAGIELPPADSMDDERLHDKLWEVIRQLGQMRVFLENTDHLSDRELYVRLTEDLLREERRDLPVNPNSAWHLDLLGELELDEVAAPGPHDRDRHLPRP